MKTLTKIVALFSFLTIVGCSSLPESVRYEVGNQESSMLLVDEYRIGVDDIVQVNVWQNPDLSITVPVRPDGRISVPLIGEVVAGGKTPVEVSEDITQRLSQYVRGPQVAVILTDLRSHEFLSRVRISGAVNAPRSMPFRQGMSVLDVVLEAGGLNDFAAGNGAKLYRKTKSEVLTMNIKLEDILEDGNMKTNILIEPGDILSVPERIF